MKRNNIYLATAAALLALAGCDRALEPSGGAITVEASIGPMTKVQTTGVATTFETGDRIAVYAWTGGADSVPASRTVNGVPNTLGTDGKWTPAAPMYWQNATDAHYFLGVSPVRTVSDFTADPFTLDPADYVASDLLVAANFGTGGAGLKDTGANVPLTFHHAMARLDVNLRFRSEWTTVPAADQVRVSVTAKSGASVNYLTQTVTAAGSAGAVPMLASAAAGGYHLGFKSIQVPQEGVRRITVSLDGMDYVYEASEDIPLESGKFTTLSLVLGKDKLELADVAVSDWTEIADLPGGEASGTWDLATPLTIEAIEAGAQVTFTFSTVVAENSVQYRTWSGAAWGDWTTYTGGLAITLTNVGDKLQFRGDNASYATSSSNYSSIRFDKNCYVYGNIMSLITSTGYSTATTLTGSYSFCKLFYYNICLKSHATKQLLLPATTLADSCYESMFKGCVNLTSTPVLPATTLATACYANMFLSCSMLSSPPALPATTLAKDCYQGMFEGCENLTSTPVLPATTLAQNCYANMFGHCLSLTTAPVLPATTLADFCYNSMFAGCSSLTTAPTLPAETLAEYCYYCMFSGCSSLTTAPALPATTLAECCYESMFEGCVNLTTVPAELPATTLAVGCCAQMFEGCTGLTSAPNLTASTLAVGCYARMFEGCTGLTSAPNLTASTLADDCYYGMFSGCTSLTAAPGLAATTLAVGCYARMFEGCTGLTSTPVLPATTLAKDCYSSMFVGCSSLTTAPALPATTLAECCYESMFEGCENLTSTPVLPATTLATACYANMFSSCSMLSSPPALPATTLAKDCYSSMFAVCSSLTTAPTLPAETLADFCYYSMFSGCSSLTTAPALPATTLAESCYEFMFHACTNLTAAPVLPATTLTKECYYGMFRYCFKLASVTCLATDISASECTKEWLKNAGRDVSGQKTFTTPSTTAWSNDDNGIPNGWTRVDYVAPVVP